MIDLLPSGDQSAIIDSIAAFAADRLPVSRLRTTDGPRAELREWAAMGALGWFALGIDEAWGGGGQSPVEEMLLFREAGRYLMSPSLLATVLAAHVGVACGDRELVEAVATGKRRVGLGAVHADIAPDGVANGTVSLVDGADAPLVLLWDHGGVGVYARAAQASPRGLPAWDGSIALERASVSDWRPLHWVAAGSSSLTLRAGLLIAAQMTGIAEATRDMATDYARTRQQFGKAIGAFQAVAHHCADMGVRAHAALSQTTVAALCLQGMPGDAAFQSASAWLIATDAARRNAAVNIQVHGGIGYTADCPAHFYMKRAHVLEQMSPARRSFQRQVLHGAPGMAGSEASRTERVA